MTLRITTTVQSDDVTGHVSVTQSIEITNDAKCIETTGENVEDDAPPSLYPGPVKAQARPVLRVVEAA